jgi:hypothetical protein
VTAVTFWGFFRGAARGSATGTVGYQAFRGLETSSRKPSKSDNVPKPIWTGEVIGRNAHEHKEHDHRTGHTQEAVEFVAQLLHKAMIRAPAPS